MRGLSEGYDPHLFDVAKLVQKRWTEVPEMFIWRCLIKVRVFIFSNDRWAQGNIRKNQKTSKPDDLKIIFIHLNKFSILTDRGDPFYVWVQDTVTETNIENWIHLEEQSSIRDTFVQDIPGYFSPKEDNNEV